MPFLGHGGPYNQWLRVVMNRETHDLIARRSPESMKVLEISGSFWKDRFRFKDYRSVYFPEYDVCAAPMPETFDLIVAEQVFEHLAWPYRAAKNIHAMLNPGGLFLVTTPFLVKIHEEPLDCTRWSATGMRHFLAECGFPLDKVEASSWGNRACVKANFRRWQIYQPWRHSLKDERLFPVAVWALAQKGD